LEHTTLNDGECMPTTNGECWQEKRLTTPPNSNLAPPGWYMIIVVENQVPSIAQWIQIGGDPANFRNYHPSNPGWVDQDVPGPGISPDQCANVLRNAEEAAKNAAEEAAKKDAEEAAKKAAEEAAKKDAEEAAKKAAEELAAKKSAEEAAEDAAEEAAKKAAEELAAKKAAKKAAEELAAKKAADILATANARATQDAAELYASQVSASKAASVKATSTLDSTTTNSGSRIFPGVWGFVLAVWAMSSL
jgi:hypothetical protein